MGGWLSTSACTGYLIYDVLENPDAYHELHLCLFVGSIIFLGISVLILLRNSKLQNNRPFVFAGALGAISGISILFGFTGEHLIDGLDVYRAEVHVYSSLLAVFTAVCALAFLMYAMHSLGADVYVGGGYHHVGGGYHNKSVFIAHTLCLAALGATVGWTVLANSMTSNIVLIWALAFFFMINMWFLGEFKKQSIPKTVYFAAGVFAACATGSLLCNEIQNLSALQGFQYATVATGGLFVLALLWTLFRLKDGTHSPIVFLVGAGSIVAMTVMLSFNIGFVEGLFTSGSPCIWAFFGCGCVLLASILYGIWKRVSRVRDQ